MEPAPAPQGADPAEGIKMAVDMLSALSPMLKDMKAPPEVQDAADTLLAFLSGGGQEQPPGPGAEQAGGNPNARPMA